jgi:hypothetical protein
MSEYVMETEFAESYDYSPEYTDYTDYSPDYSPEAPPSRGRGGYRNPPQPQRGGNYTRPPTMPTPVSQEQLRQALARVKQDIDRVANGVRANTSNLNDFAGRTTRNLNRVRDEHRREIGRLDQSVAGARDLGILGAVLAGGDNAKVTLPLLVVAMDQQSQQAATAGAAPGAPAPGGILGGSNSTGLVLALAVAGALKP